MKERRRGLGRGLGALIPSAPSGAAAEENAALAASLTAPAEVPVPAPAAERGLAAAKVVGLRDRAAEGSPEGAGAAAVSRETGGGAAAVAGAFFAEVPAESIRPNPQQPRTVFDEDQLAELVTSIKEVGLLQPIVVRRLEADSYELIMGERRWRACREAGLEHVPAIIRATDDDRLLLDALLENLHRAQLNPLEEAAAYDQLLNDFSCTHEELADRIGRSRSQVSNTLRLLRLSPRQQDRVAAGVLSAGHARALLALDGSDEQDALAQRIVNEQLSVREVEDIIRQRGQGAAAKKPKGPRAGRRLAPELDELSGRLADRFETRVKVDLGQKKGKITVEFASLDDLERILSVMAPGEGKVLARQGAAEEE